MYNDFRNPGRDRWMFTYVGRELATYADAKRLDYKERELKARNDLAELLADSMTSQDDPRITQLQKEITESGTQYECCVVYTHEFHRHPDREYSLSLADVVYFGLTDG